MALVCIWVSEAKKNLWTWFIEGVACTSIKVEAQIVLTLQLATNNFTHLKSHVITLDSITQNDFEQKCKQLPAVGDRYNLIHQSTRRCFARLLHSHNER